MKTYTILFGIILIMYTVNLINTTILDGEWHGVVFWLSSVLFIIGAFFHAAEYQANKKRKQSK